MERRNLSIKHKRNPRCCTVVCLAVFGTILSVAGILTFCLWPSLIKLFLQNFMALTPNSQVYDGWVETPIPVYFKMYMFNWTNPETSLRGPDKPAFQQLGPYVFLKHQIKRDIVWNDNDTITYKIEDQYKNFIPEMSNGSLSDRVTNINVIPLIIGWKLRHSSRLEKFIVDGFLKLVESNLVKTDTVGNMLFDGSKDPILSIAHLLKPFVKDLPDKFGYLKQQNFSTTMDGVYTMNTGKNNIYDVGLASAWDYSNHTVLSGDCGRVYGSFGELYSPKSYHQDKLYMFGYATCSAGVVHRDGFSSVSGVPTAVFIGKEDSFSNTTECFCPPNDPCPLNGVRDLSQCQGVPFLMSFPHFYLADPAYREAVEGLNPDPSLHQLRFEMSDVTAATVIARFKTQMSFQLQPIKGMSLFNGVQKVVMPLFWTSQEADLPQSKLDSIYWVVKAVYWGNWVSLAFGGLGLVIGYVAGYKYGQIIRSTVLP